MSKSKSKITKGRAKDVDEYLHIDMHDAVDVLDFELRALRVDPTVQRDLVASYASRIAKQWDSSLCDALHVSARDVDGDDVEYVVIDGQHRFHAALANDVKTLPVRVHYGLSKTEEAALHIRLQSQRKSDTASDAWRLRIAAESPEHVAFVDGLDERGLHVAKQASKNVLACHATLHKYIVRFGHETVLDAVDAAEAAFGRTQDTWQSSVISGFCLLLGKFPDVAMPQALGEKVEKRCGRKGWDVADFVIAVQRSSTSSGGRPAKTAHLLATMWNHGRSRRSSMYEFAIPVASIDDDD